MASSKFSYYSVDKFLGLLRYVDELLCLVPIPTFQSKHEYARLKPLCHVCVYHVDARVVAEYSSMSSLYLVRHDLCTHLALKLSRKLDRKSSPETPRQKALVFI